MKLLNFINSNYVGLYQKNDFGSNFEIWEVPKIDNDYDDDDDDDDEEVQSIVAKFCQVQVILATFIQDYSSLVKFS